MFAASDIFSVIGPAKSEKSGEQTQRNERIERRQLAGIVRLKRKGPSLLGFREVTFETPCLPAIRLRRAEFRCGYGEMSRRSGAAAKADHFCNRSILQHREKSRTSTILVAESLALQKWPD